MDINKAVIKSRIRYIPQDDLFAKRKANLKIQWTINGLATSLKEKSGGGLGLILN